jgi:hypothetical protein
MHHSSTRSAYASEKVRDDQLLEKVHPSMVLVPSLTLETLYETNLLCNAGKLWTYNHSSIL